MDRLLLSALDWWEEAGVDTLVDELPRDWLAPLPAPVVAAPPPEPGPGTPALPATLADFRAWLLADASVPGRPGTRLDAIGDAAQGSAILLDMPEIGDRAEGRLLSGGTGALFDRMLAAMTLSRESAYLFPFSPARLPSGRPDVATVATLTRLARHHLALVAPRRLLIAGEAPVRALLGIGCAEARGRVHQLALDARTIAVVATFPPRVIEQASSPDEIKARRAAIWSDLQLYMEL